MGKHKLNGKVAIITGSSKGIGKAVAITLGKKGVNIVVNGRNLEKLNNTRDELANMGLSVIAVQGDVSKYADCQKLVATAMQEFKQIDILINNAGIAMEGKIEETAPEVFNKVLDTNILGVLYPTKVALPYIKNSKGSIVFTGSIAGLMGLPGYAAYSISKMALTALAQSLKIELKGTGVHIGINYVGFAENDKDKTFINANGNVETMPLRENFKRMPIDKVAAIIVSGIEKRRYKQTLSLLGKLTLYMQRYFPGIFEHLLLYKYKP